MGDRRRCGTRTPRFSANRAIREYTEKYHLPAAQRYLHSTENRAALAIELVDVQRRIDDHWQGIYFGKLENKDSDNGYHFRLQVYLDDLVSDAVRNELFADQSDGLPAERYPMTRGERLVGAKGWMFAAHVVSERPAEHFTPRAYAHHPELAVPLECPPIKWQR